MKPIINKGKRRVWTELECTKLVNTYAQMYANQQGGQGYSKAPLVRLLMADIDRSKGSIEAKLMNVSGILAAAGHDYVQGYKPLGNCQKILVDIVRQQFGLEVDND